jgi:hypothetical protein
LELEAQAERRKQPTTQMEMQAARVAHQLLRVLTL